MELHHKTPPDPFEEQTTTTIAEAFDVMVMASGIVYKNAKFLSRIVKPLMYLVVALIVSQGLQHLSLVQRDKKVDEIRDTVSTLHSDVAKMQDSSDAAKIASEQAQEASVQARIASEAAKKSLDEAISQSQRGGVNPEIVDALKKINDLYEACAIKKEC